MEVTKIFFAIFMGDFSPPAVSGLYEIPASTMVNLLDCTERYPTRLPKMFAQILFGRMSNL
jgi:hypothetical protein